MNRSVRRDAHVRACELVAGEEQRFVGEAGRRVGEAISEIEIRGVAAASKAQPGVGGGTEVGIGERRDGDITLQEEAADETARVAVEPGRYDDRRLHEGGGADGDVTGICGEGGDEAFPDGFTQREPPRSRGSRAVRSVTEVRSRPLRSLDREPLRSFASLAHGRSAQDDRGFLLLSRK